MSLGTTFGAIYFGMVFASMCVHCTSQVGISQTILPSLFGITILQMHVYYQHHPSDCRLQKISVRTYCLTVLGYETKP